MSRLARIESRTEMIKSMQFKERKIAGNEITKINPRRNYQNAIAPV